jgi:hypothetical protein
MENGGKKRRSAAFPVRALPSTPPPVPLTKRSSALAFELRYRAALSLSLCLHRHTRTVFVERAHPRPVQCVTSNLHPPRSRPRRGFEIITYMLEVCMYAKCASLAVLCYVLTRCLLKCLAVLCYMPTRFLLKCHVLKSLFLPHSPSGRLHRPRRDHMH